MASWISALDASKVRSSPLRDAGREEGGWSDVGGGGIGALFASPTRRSVIVS